MKSKEAIAWEDWLKSRDGQACCNPLPLGEPAHQQRYLKNRLWYAFKAGVACGRAIQDEEKR